ncbi:MAG: uroporphyrinogen-III synthase [Alphaproteobacteria bacterium]|nr:uroporphyrinogen-III synthase [Alphaproteobacteria bacterium]NNF24173.1 uroporphyrinogen-III synthase [Paracoccaceae bacterium]
MRVQMPDVPLIVLTRPAAQAERFAQHCARRFGGRIETLIAPVLKIEPLRPDLEPKPEQSLVFTSENGVLALGPNPAVKGRTAYCVGPQTANAARALGMDAIDAGGAAGDLIARILADMPPGPLLHVRGAHARGHVAQALKAAGLDTQEVIAYRQTEQPLSSEAILRLSGSAPVILPVFSPRSAKLLAMQVPRLGPGVLPISLSAAVAEALPASPNEPVVVAEPNGEAMLASIERHLPPESAC